MSRRSAFWDVQKERFVYNVYNFHISKQIGICLVWSKNRNWYRVMWAKKWQDVAGKISRVLVTRCTVDHNWEVGLFF